MTRALALAAVVSGIVLGVLLASIQEYARKGMSGGCLPYLPDSWYDEYEGLYDRAGARWGLSPYYFWGRFASLVYLAGLAGAWALPASRSRLARRGRRLLLVAFWSLSSAMLWRTGGGTDEDLTTLTSIGFGLVETPALLLMTAAMVIYGVGLACDGVRPRWAPWCLVAGRALAPPVALLGITYVPHGVLITVLSGIALALVGFVTRSRVLAGLTRPATAVVKVPGTWPRWAARPEVVLPPEVRARATTSHRCVSEPPGPLLPSPSAHAPPDRLPRSGLVTPRDG